MAHGAKTREEEEMGVRCLTAALVPPDFAADH